MLTPRIRDFVAFSKAVLPFGGLLQGNSWERCQFLGDWEVILECVCVLCWAGECYSLGDGKGQARAPWTRLKFSCQRRGHSCCPHQFPGSDPLKKTGSCRLSTREIVASVTMHSGKGWHWELGKRRGGWKFMSLLDSSGDGLRAAWCPAGLAATMEIPVLLCLTRTYHPRVATGPWNMAKVTENWILNFKWNLTFILNGFE